MILGCGVHHVTHVGECLPGEAAHVESQPEEVRVDQRADQRVAEHACADQQAKEDGDLAVCHETHGWVVVLLDPSLDHLSDLLGHRWRRCWVRRRCTSRRGGCGEHHGDYRRSQESEDVEKREDDEWNQRDWRVMGQSMVSAQTICALLISRLGTHGR